jgi:hypothetical protein
MTRKDPAQDLERPHFYSQYWIDVASGKRDFSVARAVEADVVPEEDEEFAAPLDTAISKPAPKPKKPEKKPEPVRPTITSLADLANIDMLMRNSAEMEGEVPDLESGDIGEFEPFAAEAESAPAETEYSTEDLAEVEAADMDTEEDEYGFEDEFEEEEEDEWGGARRPSKQTKPRRRERDRHTPF